MSNTVLEMAKKAGLFTHKEVQPEIRAFAELVRADERNSWPAEMEAMERQVNILTDALAKQPVQQKPVAWAMYQKGQLLSFWMDKRDAYDFEFTSEHSWAPLYTAPQPAQQEPVACPVCNQVHTILDADESQIIRNAKDGYPYGRTPRLLTLQERVTALCQYASDWKRWCLEKENPSPQAQPAQRTDDTKRLDAVTKNSWDLRCFAMPTGADDADIGWRVIEHHMAKPHERTVAEVFRDDPRQAIDAAIEAEAIKEKNT